MRRRGVRAGGGAEAAVPRSGGTRRLGLLALVVFVAALVQRIWFLRSSPDHDVFYSLFYFDHAAYLYSYASSLVRGVLFNKGLSFHPPLPAFVLALVFRVAGESVSAVKVLYAILGSLTAVLVFFTGRMFFSTRTGFWAAALWGASFGGLVLSSGVNAETPFLFFLLLACLFAGSAPRSPSPLVNAIGAGVLCGFMALTRTEGLWIAVPFAVHFLWTAANRRRGAKAAAVVVAAAVLTVAPWAVRCHRLLAVYAASTPGRVASGPSYGPITLTGGLDFALANNTGADGGFNYDLIGGYVHDEAGLGEFNVLYSQRHGYREGWFFASRHPARFGRLLAAKIGRLASAAAIGFLPSNVPEGASGVRPVADFFQPERSRLLVPVLVIFLGGLAASARHPRRPVLLYLVFLYYAVWTMAYAGRISSGVMLLPIVYLFCADAAAFAASRLKKAWLGKAGDVAIGVLLAAAVIAGYVDHSRQKVLRLEAEKGDASISYSPVKITLE